MTEAGHDSFDHTLTAVTGKGAEAAADWQNLKSPETYVGYGRSDTFSSPGREAFNRSRTYAAPARLALNESRKFCLVILSQSGSWPILCSFAKTGAMDQVFRNFLASRE